MSIDTTQLESDLGNMINDLPATLVFSGAVGGTFLAALTDFKKSKNLQEGGFIADFDLQATAKRSSFTTLPSTGVTIGNNSTTLRVAETVLAADGVTIIIGLITPDK